MTQENPLLLNFGRGLRHLREQRGLGVGETARAAGLSRRTLTEAEAGRTNPSLLVLVALAEALELSCAELVASALRPRASRRVALFGLRGAGKTSVGKRLAQQLEVPFVELDQRVEQLAGLSLAEIFALQGQAHFHQLESEAIEQVLSEGDELVLATGGSIVDSPANFVRLLSTCRSVWLSATPSEHFERVLAQGDRRPMHDRPRAMEELRALLARREPHYAHCEFSIATSGRTVDEVVQNIGLALQQPR